MQISRSRGRKIRINGTGRRLSGAGRRDERGVALKSRMSSDCERLFSLSLFARGAWRMARGARRATSGRTNRRATPVSQPARRTWMLLAAWLRLGDHCRRRPIYRTFSGPNIFGTRALHACRGWSRLITVASTALITVTIVVTIYRRFPFTVLRFALDESNRRLIL